MADSLLDRIATNEVEGIFPEKYFPKTQTQNFLELFRQNCDIKNRKGNFVNEFYHKKVSEDDIVSFIYEYYLNCDSSRFIISYKLGDEIELFELKIEGIEQDNSMITKPERRLYK